MLQQCFSGHCHCSTLFQAFAAICGTWQSRSSAPEKIEVLIAVLHLTLLTMATIEGASFVRLVQVVRVGRVVLVAQAALADQRQPLAVLDWDLWAARVLALLELAARVLAPLELAARVLAPLELDL